MPPPLDFRIRPYQPADAPELAQVYFDAARQLGARRYTPEQVLAWAPAPPEAEAVERRAGDGRLTLVAVGRNGRVLAYGDLEASGHVDHLYRRPDASGRGVAAAIVDELIGRARASQIPKLHVEASELARGLFERKGFVLLHRRDFEVRGVAMHNYAMQRSVD